MTVANIIIDLIAVFVFQSLVAVAIGTVIFTAVGIFLGFYFLRKEIAINTTHMASETMFFIKNIKTQLKP